MSNPRIPQRMMNVLADVDYAQSFQWVLDTGMSSTEVASRIWHLTGVQVSDRTVRHWRTLVDQQNGPSDGSMSDSVVNVPESTPKPYKPVLDTPEAMSVEYTENGVDIECATGDAATILEESGLDPQDWEVDRVHVSEWTMPGREDPGKSARYSFKRLRSDVDVDFDIDCDSIAKYLNSFGPVPDIVDDQVLVIALGDTQIGKIENGDVSYVVERALACVASSLDYHLNHHPWTPANILVSFLGDHSEGFVSQGGTNVFRTRLTQTEQIRATRTLMYGVSQLVQAYIDATAGYAIMAACPGNHDQAVRVGGKGVTRYDDSHDTESLICVSEIYKASGAKGITFHVPSNDNLSVYVTMAGTNFLLAHGHQMKAGKAMEWWKKQAFNNDHAAAAHVLLTGHFHHYHSETDGDRIHVQVPALENGSHHFENSQGARNSPGIFSAVCEDGRMVNMRLEYAGVNYKGDKHDN